MYPTDRKYTKDHEWIQLSGPEGTVGITDYAQQQLGDVVFVELPDIGRRVAKGEMFGTIESVKAVSELYSPMGGEVVGVNGELTQHPEQVNQAPHDTWMVRLRLSSPGEEGQLL
jgi:glycine cleavage system H protein